MKYNSCIDGLRGVAILLVLLVHARVPYCDGGFIGVDVFFVISGFLITSLLLAEHSKNGFINLPRFYIRRVLRLFPALFFLLLLYGAASCFSVNPYRHFREIGAVMLYFSNWVQAFRLFNIVEIGHLWSLSVEEQFYFVWPIMLYFSLRLQNGVKLAAAIACSGVLASIGTRVFLAVKGADTFRLYFGSDTRLDNIFLGALAAVLISTYGNPPKALLKWLPTFGWPAVGIFLVTGFSYPLSGMYTYGLTTVGMAALAILLPAAYGSTSWWSNALLHNKFLVWTGKLSYSLYLWHFVVMEPVNKIAKLSTGPKAAIGIVTSYAVASFSYYFIEKRFLAMKDSYSGARASQSAAAVQTVEQVAG